MKKLDLSKCKDSSEVGELVRERVNSIPYDDLLDHVNSKFVYLESTVKALWTGLAMNMNVFLSGPGGYGKTSLIKCVLDFYKIPYHTVVGYKDMPVDALLGIPNMPKLLKESEYELNFQKSVFFKPGVLIGEEFTDILPSTAAALKDILTERGFRNKGAFVPSRVSTMIVAANKHPREIADDESKKAFYNERFPIKEEVVWDKYAAEDYQEFLVKVFPKAKEALLYFMAKLFEVNHVKFNNTISPRTAIAITEVYLDKGIDFISYFDIILEDIQRVGRIASIEFNKKSIEDTFTDVCTYIDSLPYGVERKAAIMYAINSLSNQVIPAEAIEYRQTALDHLKKELQTDRARLASKPMNKIDDILKQII